jgi:hypothetical protein
MQKKIFLIFTAFLFVLNMVFAEETAVNKDSSVIVEPALKQNATEQDSVKNTPSVKQSSDEQNTTKITPTGFAYYQIGQIEHITPDNEGASKVFEQIFTGRLTLNAIVNKRLQVTAGIEGTLKASLTDNSKISAVVLKEAYGIYSCGDPENSYLTIESGYFPIKYNPEAQNLGEYLYRTGTYPQYIITDFDFPKARLMGFNFSSTLLDNNLRLNALLTSEFQVKPYFDYSLSFLAAYKLPNKILDIGAGIDFDRLLPIGGKEKNTIAVTDNNGAPVIEDGDTLKYSMHGTKIMGRLTFDPKPLLPFADLLGENDFKLYGEFVILGTKNYGGTDSIGTYGYYPKISQRMPVMVGFDIPTFKTIDIVSLELEYLGCNPKYTLDIPSKGDPTPGNYTGTERSYFKWSIYGVKTIAKGWAIKGVIGKDHYRGLDLGSGYDANERMNGPYDWHYNLRIMYSF